MALSASTVWETRASGTNDNNGGGFVAGASGTDYSQQNAAQLTLTDLATTGVVTTLTSVTGGFTAAMVGNLIQIVSGTNFTAGFYQITVFTNSNTVTLDRAPSTAAGSAGTGSVGGALATLAKLAGAMIASNKAYATGAFTSTATTTFAQTVSSGAATPLTRLIGYGSVRGDAGHATLTLATNTGLTGINTSGAGFSVEQVDVNCASLGTSTGLSSGGGNGLVLRCMVSNFTTAGIATPGNNVEVVDCEVTGGTAAATAAINTTGGPALVYRNNVHDNACPGIVLAANTTGAWNLVTNNTGASSSGIKASSSCAALNNTCHGNGQHGITLSTDSQRAQQIRNNLLTNNGGYGISATGNQPAAADYDGNAFYSNTSGTRNNLDNTTGIYGVTPYVNIRDVTLTGSPYVGPTSGGTANFGLNNTAGAGAACKAAATPGTWPGNTGTTGFLDMGAVQSKGAGVPGIIVAPG